MQLDEPLEFDDRNREQIECKDLCIEPGFSTTWPVPAFVPTISLRVGVCAHPSCDAFPVFFYRRVSFSSDIFGICFPKRDLYLKSEHAGMSNKIRGARKFILLFSSHAYSTICSIILPSKSSSVLHIFAVGASSWPRSSWPGGHSYHRIVIY